MPPEHIQFLEAPAGYVLDGYPLNGRQLLIVLEGGIEITVPDQLSQRFSPGAAVLFEDTAGSGCQLHFLDASLTSRSDPGRALAGVSCTFWMQAGCSS